MYAATLAIMLVSVSAAPAEYQDGYQNGADAAACECDECSECGCQNGGGHFGRHGRRDRSVGRACGPMPQTCYAPRYGCYPGNNRHMHRYPAFHGVYYRRPYNYRNLYDYPWHAELHEPTSLFSHETPDEEQYDDDVPAEQLGDAPPRPQADPASVRRADPAGARRASSARRANTSRNASTIKVVNSLRNSRN